MSLELNESQQEGYDKILAFLVDPNQKYFILSGGPGTGKSHMINYMMENLSKAHNTLSKVMGTAKYYGVAVTATTNSAVDNLNSDSHIGGVSTIQSLLSLIVRDGSLIQRHPVTLRNSIVVIDEYTLIDHTLFKYIDEGTVKVILVGDADQLLAVKGLERTIKYREPDHILDIPMRTKSPDILHTTKIFLDHVRGEEADDLDITGMSDVVAMDEDEFMSLIDDPDFSFAGSRIITHTNHTSIQINQAIRQARGLPDHFVPYERVVLNRYTQVGKRGYKTDAEYTVVSYDDDGAYTVQDQWGIYHSMNTDKFDLRSMYCSTVYKAQGRSFDTIYIDLTGFPNNITRSTLTRALYVGVSRARQKVVFIGDLPERVLEKL